jgi:hypothetical protein
LPDNHLLQRLANGVEDLGLGLDLLGDCGDVSHGRFGWCVETKGREDDTDAKRLLNDEGAASA